MKLLPSAALALSLTSMLLLSACTDGDEAPQEPVSPDAESGTGYSEDPDMSPPAGEDAPPEDSAAAGEDTPGALTDDPFGAPPEGAPKDEGATADDYGKSFDNDPPAYEAPEEPVANTAPTIPDEVEPDSGDAPAASSASGGQYVDALLLNVRSGPNMRSPIVRRLLGGARVEVLETRGKYAKIKNGQWVAAKYLSDTPTRKVSRAEVAKAWKKSRYKDNWKPGN
jgi:hypothetical protein